MATTAADKTTGKVKDAAGKAKETTEQAKDTVASGPLKAAMGQLIGVLADRAASALTDRVGDAAQRLNEYASGDGHGGLLAALTGATRLAEGKGPLRALLGAGVSGVGSKIKSAVGGITGGKGGDGGHGRDLKVTNIVESIDVGAPIELVYDQWTRFTEFPTFMKKVENIEQVSDEKLVWKAQICWSHRAWEATITDQVPNERIVWRSEGEKGYVDGAVTFHELAPQLTRILVVLEYHPRGLVEKTGNIWRAPGRRARLELKHFRRHVMTTTLLHPEEVEGWHGEIHDGEVVDQSEEGGEPEEDMGEEEDLGEPVDEGDYEEGDYEEPEEEPEEPEPPRRRATRRKAGQL